MSLDKRKHISQMSKSEINFLHNRIGDLSMYQLTDYAYCRKDTRNIFDDCIKKAFCSYDIIEYHVMSGSPRILVRGNCDGLQVCMVVQPLGRKIVTMYYNHISDQHDTINMSQYDGSINIFDTFRHHHTIPDVTPEIVEFVPPIPEPVVIEEPVIVQRFHTKNIGGNLHEVRIWCNENLKPEDKIIFIERVNGYMSVLMWEGEAI